MSSYLENINYYSDLEYFFCFRMPNEYIWKTDRGTASVEMYDLAFEEVRLRGKSLRNAAVTYNLNYMSFSRYIAKKEARGISLQIRKFKFLSRRNLR